MPAVTVSAVTLRSNASMESACRRMFPQANHKSKVGSFAGRELPPQALLGSMVFRLSLDSPAKRVAAMAVTVTACCLLAFQAASNFIIGALIDQRIGLSRDSSKASFILAPLTDERVGISPEALTAAANHFSNSPRLEARLAEAQMMEGSRDLVAAELHGLRAVSLSPYSYTLRMLLATIEEAKGDSRAVEQSLRQAVALAPNNIEVHSRLANLLLVNGNLAEALEEFRRASASNTSFLLEAFDSVWAASGGSLNAMEVVAGTEPKDRIKLARFLLEQSQTEEAVKIFSGIDRNDRLNSPDSSAFLNLLIVTGHMEQARNLWIEQMSGDQAPRANSMLIWNGSFETDIQKNFSQFDWTSNASDYARISIDARASRTGTRSLRIDFLGRNTTRLDGEIKQVVTVHLGTRYKLECYVKTERFVTPEGPQIVVTDTSGNWLAASSPVAAGSSDWTRVAIEFTAPARASDSAPAVYVSVKRKPKFSFDEPTRGTIWLDDFEMKEQ